jgi:hypothetical protein
VCFEKFYSSIIIIVTKLQRIDKLLFKNVPKKKILSLTFFPVSYLYLPADLICDIKLIGIHG